jgi:hypothetical protein
MAITSDLIRVTFRAQVNAQKVEVVQSYAVAGAALLAVNCTQVAEALWNDVKVKWRAAVWDYTSYRFKSVFCEEIQGSLGFGEYPIPAGEQPGTRGPAAGTDDFPPFVAAGVRLTVASRVTRPGQKRFWGANETDQMSGVWGATYLGLLNTLMANWVAARDLGAPAALVGVIPQVVSYDRITGLPTARQDVTGYLINTSVTTQNSRKYGHGA